MRTREKSIFRPKKLNPPEYDLPRHLPLYPRFRFVFGSLLSVPFTIFPDIGCNKFQRNYRFQNRAKSLSGVRRLRVHCALSSLDFDDNKAATSGTHSIFLLSPYPPSPLLQLSLVRARNPFFRCCASPVQSVPRRSSILFCFHRMRRRNSRRKMESLCSSVQGRAKKFLLSSVTHVPSGLMGCALAALVSGQKEGEKIQTCRNLFAQPCMPHKYVSNAFIY